jgi:predicted regulator of Ras-like GTPase activity (Roadblock/LC7/MglB family)
MTRDAIAELGPDDVRTMEILLRAFVREAAARAAFLLDRRGRALASAGDVTGMDETSFASLAVADFEASGQLALLLGQPEFTALYHQGVHGSMYLSDIRGVAILAVVFDPRTTLGMVRLKTREILPRLTMLLEAVEKRQPRKGGLDAGWGDLAASQIDRLLAG